MSHVRSPHARVAAVVGALAVLVTALVLLAGRAPAAAQTVADGGDDPQEQANALAWRRRQLQDLAGELVDERARAGGPEREAIDRQLAQIREELASVLEQEAPLHRTLADQLLGPLTKEFEDKQAELDAARKRLGAAAGLGAGVGSTVAPADPAPARVVQAAAIGDGAPPDCPPRGGPC